MVDTTFDDWTKAFGTLTSRRLTVGALLGGALAHAGLDHAGATAGHQSHRRRAGTEAKSGNCNPACGTCQTCQTGKCKKKRGKKKCKPGTCVPASNGTTCTTSGGGNGSCQSGSCQLICSGGQTNCSGVCTDLQTDPNNCGACGHSCGVIPSCLAGICAPG